MTPDAASRNLLVLVICHGGSSQCVLVGHLYAIGDAAHHSWVELHLIRTHLPQHLLLLALLHTALLLWKTSVVWRNEILPRGK
jgi:hypothetical protein